MQRYLFYLALLILAALALFTVSRHRPGRSPVVAGDRRPRLRPSPRMI